MTLEPGPLIARGREADVFAAGDGRVLRRYRGGQSAEPEVMAMSWAREHGYPAPEVFDCDGAAMLMERIHGPTMLADLRRHPWRALTHADLLARLHRDLHTIPPPPGLPAASGTSGDDFLHLDLHPENVIIGPAGPVVIDWAAARRGGAVFDVAYSWLIMTSSEIPGPATVRLVAAAFRRTVVERFLSHFDRAVVLGILPAAAQHRLEDRNVTPLERERIHRIVEQFLAIKSSS